MTESARLSGEEKTFIALAAAMGGGCRTCADRLFAVAQSLDMDVEDIDRGFRAGLGVRDAATRLMRQKAHALHPREREPEDGPAPDPGDGILELARLAAAVAANAAPAALGHAQAARETGASEAAIGVAIGIGQTIRGKAQEFSDGELGGARDAEVGCAPSAGTAPPASARGPGADCGCDGALPRAPTSCCGR